MRPLCPGPLRRSNQLRRDPSRDILGNLRLWPGATGLNIGLGLGQDIRVGVNKLLRRRSDFRCRDTGDFDILLPKHVPDTFARKSHGVCHNLAADLVLHRRAQSFLGRIDQKPRSRVAFELHIAIDALQRLDRHHHVDAGGLRPRPIRRRHKQHDAVAVLRISHHLIERRRFRDELLVLFHPFEMQSQRLGRHLARLIQRRAGRDTARKVRKRYAEIAAVVLVNERNILGHEIHVSLRPACFSMLRKVPFGMSFSGCGTVTRPGFVGCLS